MPRLYGSTGRKFGASKKVYAARKALARASVALGTGGVAPMEISRGLAPLRTGGFWGNYRGVGRGARPELKFVDVSMTNFVNATTGTITLINGIAQGSDFNNRIGRKVQIKSILLNGNLFSGPPPSNAVQGVQGMIAIIYDTQPNSGSLPAYTDIFQIADPNTVMNLNNRDRFKVLMKFRKGVNGWVSTVTPTVQGNPNNAIFSKYKKCNLEQIFSATGNTIGGISTGALYFTSVGDVTGSQIDWYTRVRFSDN